MNKYFTLASLLAISAKADAHSHPTVDSLTHSLEHLIITYHAWLPYLLGSNAVLALTIVLYYRWNRRSGTSKRRVL
ncbi:hypothetical protein [Methylomonas sp. AM2-LC]|uniref:hypothetical protein n=1 Tax=Methylomonas sp. AM2-LC TaxID=3153301 RepID=UPI0032669EFF